MQRKEAGFSLIELLVVVAIIAILAVVGITSYTGVQLRAARTEAYTNLENIRLLQEQFFADSGCYEQLVAGVCPNPGNVYTCLFNDANNCTDAGEIANANMLPRFRPGAGRKFNYTITVANGIGLPNPVPIPYTGVTVALPVVTTPCFIVTATGADGKVAEIPDVFAIDCNNNRNF